MKKFFLLILFSCLFLFSATANAGSKAPELTEDTTAAIYLDAAQIFAFYQTHIDELMKPENADSLKAIENRLQGAARSEISLGELFQGCRDFLQKELIVPDGPAWFTIDELLRPKLSLSAKIKPLELLEFIENNIDKITTKALKREQNLVEFSIPMQNYNQHLTITPGGILLESERLHDTDSNSDPKWSNFSATVASKKTLVAGEIDLDRLKHLLAGKTSNSRHAICYSNLRLLATALDMYSMDKETAVENLNQKELISERYLNSELVCPDSGTYSLNTSSETECSIHGTIKKPAKTETFASDKDIPSQVKPLKTLRFHALRDYAELALAVEDKFMIEQWAAIGKQQLLTIKNMARNQMGHLPESERQKGMKMLDSINISHDGLWIKLSVENLDESAIISGFTGLVGAVALPNFQKARQQARARACKANRRVLTSATDMYELDTGKPLKYLDIQTLVEKSYLKKAPECPEGGTYTLTGDNSDIQVDCSHHHEK